MRIFVEIETNCAGSARHVCRPGSACLSNADCESNACTNNVCEDLCGNGDLNEGEACDDGNKLACGCNLSCDGRSIQACAAGVACSANQDCISQSCVDGICEGCGNGIVEDHLNEECDDGNALSCGTCSANCRTVQTGPLCRSGTTCTLDAVCAGGSCVEGVCRDVCGNGLQETSEECDDGNADDCGSCSADCQDDGSGKCGAGIGCAVNSDCISNTCTNHVCQ